MTLNKIPFWRKGWFKATALIIFVAIAVFAVMAYQYQAALFPEPTYDEVAPEVPALELETKILIFSKTNGFRHLDAIPAARKLFENIAIKNGWNSFYTENAAIHNSEDLEQFDLLIWSNVSGDVLTPEQRQVFKAYLENGGSVLAIHGTGGDPEYSWSWHPEEFIRAQFIGHPMFPQFRQATIHIEDHKHPAMAFLPEYWQREEEWYSFAESPRDRVTVLATVDETEYDVKDEIAMGEDHPVIWHHKVSEGTVFYSALGHQASAYDEPEYQAMLEGAIKWLLEKQL
jgi:type 1 glutamine amidotransferase